MLSVRAFQRIKFTALILFLVLAGYFVSTSDISESLRTPEGRNILHAELLNIQSSTGYFTALLYILFYAFFTVLLFPGVFLTAIGALLFGTLKGTIFTLLGATIGATAAFYVARFLGKDFIIGIIGKRFNGFQESCEKHGFKTLLILRLIPIVPFNALDYGAGLTAVKPVSYIVATFFGIIPGVFLYTYIIATAGDAFFQDSFSLGSVLTPGIVFAFVGLVFLALIPLLFGEKLRRFISGN